MCPCMPPPTPMPQSSLPLPRPLLRECPAAQRGGKAALAAARLTVTGINY